MNGFNVVPKMKSVLTNVLVNILLHLMAANYRFRPRFKKYLQSDEGWINFSVGIRTKDNSVKGGIIFQDGNVRGTISIPENANITLVFADDETVREMIQLPPHEIMNLLLKNRMYTEGNIVYLSLFSYFISLLMAKRYKRIHFELKDKEMEHLKEKFCKDDKECRKALEKRKNYVFYHKKIDSGLKYLKDLNLSSYSLDDFPRVKNFLDRQFAVNSEVCHENVKLLTDWYKKHGFEKDKDGANLFPELRQARAYKNLMDNKTPVIRLNDLIAGSTTSKEIGVLIHPDAQGTAIWGELSHLSKRKLNPSEISEETRNLLHHEIFPFWAKRNFREWVRKVYNNPLCQNLDERFAVYFLWKTVAISHTIPNFPKLLALGTSGMIKEIEEEFEKDTSADDQKKDTLQAMIICLEGLTGYAKNLSRQADKEAKVETDPKRKEELERLALICDKVPENPASTLYEAINAVFIGWVGIHLENSNVGLSLGRLDQWLQPYLETDMAKLKSDKEREAYIKSALELIACFFIRCNDHLPTMPDIGNYLFGGAASNQAITLGGVTPEGEDAVNDMTYIFLKVTEMLSLRDPNMNARYNIEKNSDVYLKRVCEVNLVTAATPSIHNDDAVIASMEEYNYPQESLNNWSATGCVEPTLSGEHFGHTNCMMMNMVAALEMTLNNGRHPLMDMQVGPKTGSIEGANFETFEDFFNVFKTQLEYLIDKSVEYNNMLGKAHGYLRPTPFLSTLIEGSVEKGRDLTKGGARYNTSGAACIGLADVTDSLMAIKKIVYDIKKYSLKQIKEAIDSNYENDPKLHAMVENMVPFFGSGSEEALEIANKVTQFVHDCYGKHNNYRGGKYTVGFWSMSNHVAFGNLSGALPSGRLAGKPFTPGLTPEPKASPNLLDNLRDVAGLEPRNMANNIAFNVKVVPGGKDTPDKVVENMYYYVKTYFDMGGMQIQMNVVTSAMLRDAMMYPENYRNLIVRISGYNAYFVTLNRNLQLELIERAEYALSA